VVGLVLLLISYTWSELLAGVFNRHVWLHL
jgi:hypothetical protein